MDLSHLRPRFTPAVSAELIGSFFSQFFAGASAATASENGLGAAALGYGLGMAVMVYGAAHISGGHLNPAVTAGYMCVGAHGFTVQEGLSYILSQCIGGVLGSWVLISLLPSKALKHPFVTLGSLSDGGSWSVLALEFACTFVLVLVVFVTMVDRKRSIATNAGPLAVGVTYSLGVFAIGPFTGASLNPVRTLAPAVAFGNFRAIWVYFVATFGGGVSAAFLYTRFLGIDDGEEEGGREGPGGKKV